MSNEEQRVQHETISAIDMKVSDIVKIIKVWVPVLSIVCTIIGGFIALVITGYKFQDSLVRKPQFERSIAALMRQDSVLKASNTATNKRIDSLPKLRFTRVIQRNGKDIEVN